MAVSNPVYEVVWPLGKSVYSILTHKPRLSDLRGKTICELSDWLFRSEEVFPQIRELLPKQYPGMKFVDYTTFGTTHGAKDTELVAALPELLHKHGCDAVISGMGC